MTRARDLADFNLDGKAVTINESSADLDFRVESDNDDTAFFVQGDTGDIGISTNSPSSFTAGAGMPTIALQGNSSSHTDRSGALCFISQDGSTAKTWMYMDTDMFIQNATNSNIQFYTNNTRRMDLDNSGKLGNRTSTVKHPIHIAYSETGSIPTDHQMGASSDNKNYIGIHNTSDSATYSGIALETRTSGASRWLIANERQSDFVGDLVFRGRSGGTSSSEIVRFTTSGPVFNEDSSSAIDFRVESDSFSHMLFVDSSTNRLGLATSTPQAGYDQRAGLNGNSQFLIDASTTGGSGAGGAFLKFMGSNATAEQIAGIDGSMTNGTDGSESGILAFFTMNSGTSAEKFRIASNGDLTATDTSIASNSDQRIKDNISDFAYELDKFKEFKTRTFDWKQPTLHGEKSGVRGFVAQEIEAIDSYWVGEIEVSSESDDYQYLPDTTVTDDSNNQRVARFAKTSKLGQKDAMYVSVIQQLIAKIETLETKVAALEE